MDKFLEITQKMEKVSREERDQMMVQYRSVCICGKCPTYNPCTREKNELLFCHIGKSECTMEMKACICPTCPVKAMIGLTRAYYCIHGTEKELRKM